MRYNLREEAMQTCRLQIDFWDKLNRNLEELDALEEYQIDIFIRDYFSDNKDALSAVSMMNMIMKGIEEKALFYTEMCLESDEEHES